MGELAHSLDPGRTTGDLVKSRSPSEHGAPNHALPQNFLSAAGNLAIQRSVHARRPAEDSVTSPCACGGTCDECSKKQLQRKASGDAPDVPPDFHETLAGSAGSSLTPGLRGAMESHFDENLDGVRVHHDDAAGQAARQINARAFTTGDHVYFAEGHYQPESA